MRNRACAHVHQGVQSPTVSIWLPRETEILAVLVHDFFSVYVMSRLQTAAALWQVPLHWTGPGGGCAGTARAAAQVRRLGCALLGACRHRGAQVRIANPASWHTSASGGLSSHGDSWHGHAGAKLAVLCISVAIYVNLAVSY